MTMKYRKKLIEVAIPLEAINAASIKEKSNPFLKGHPRALHQWWARRPLPACRAVIFAQLVDDPSSHPDKFPTKEMQEEERARLFGIIEELSLWENSMNDSVLDKARAEIIRSCGADVPPLYDPFSGGGAIPFEAQRLGLDTFGSDLNPVAVAIGKSMIEIPHLFCNYSPVHAGAKSRSFYRNAEGIVEDINYYAELIQNKVNDDLSKICPKVSLPPKLGGGEATVLAWIWARTVPCPDPAFPTVRSPLVRSFDLCTKKGKRAWVEPILEGDQYHFVVKSEAAGDRGKAPEGTVKRQGATCLISKAALPFDYIRAQAKAGKMGSRLMAVIAEGPKGRLYLSPDECQESAAFSCAAEAAPNLDISHWPGRTNVVEYGMTKFGHLFTSRQLLVLKIFSDAIKNTKLQIESDAIKEINIDDARPLREGGRGANAYADALILYLSFVVDKLADYNNAICGWNNQNENIAHLFGRQSIPMTWDFVEANPSGSMINFVGLAKSVSGGLNCALPAGPGLEFQGSADTAWPATFGTKPIVSTDPPYYDNVSYADISDFFYVWLRENLNEVYPDLFSTLATPKGEELIANPYRHGGKDNSEAFFLTGMTKAFSNIRQNMNESFPATIYYAFKQNEVSEDGVSSPGWATFLQSVIDAGFSITGTWPVRTERVSGLKGNFNALATSVVLSCRKRPSDLQIITKSEFIRILKRELSDAIAEIQAANIAPADMPQSAIGPGMSVFSRYKAVLESDDSPMSVKAALQLINRELDEYLGGIQGEFDPDTRFAITWFEQNGLSAGDYGTANNLATARGISVESVKHAGIVESSAGKVRILNREELDPDWHPSEDKHLTIWECLQYLVQSHENQGLSDRTAVLLRQIGDKAEAVKDLAYCLYDICANKRKDAKEATAYNAIIADWTELSRLAATVHDTSARTQLRFDV